MKREIKPVVRTPKRPWHDCMHCCGTGEVPLSDELWATLQKVSKFRNGAITDDLREEGVTREAINNRLVDLESLDLVFRVGKQGKFIRWKAKRT